MTTSLSNPFDELIVDPRTGEMRQAGSDGPGAAIIEFKTRCQSSLFHFAYFILKRTRLSPHFHGPLCTSLCQIPPRRKMRLLPRGTFKTTLISQALPIFIQIQDEKPNPFWPGRDGSDIPILLACETVDLAASRVRWINGQWENNKWLRALWPHKAWEKPRAESKKWNEKEMIIPRPIDYPEPSIKAIGVDGAITGHHYFIQIKDDLISFEAMNSPAVMSKSKEWFRATRPLMAPDEELGLEFTLGTRWAPDDLYEGIMNDDPTVSYVVRALIENGQSIFPEEFSLEKIEELRRSEGHMFYLWRMNSAADPSMTDFDVADLRYYEWIDGQLFFKEDERDVAMRRALGAASSASAHVGQTLSPRELAELLQPTPDQDSSSLSLRDDYFMGKYGRKTP